MILWQWMKVNIASLVSYVFNFHIYAFVDFTYPLCLVFNWFFLDLDSIDNHSTFAFMYSLKHLTKLLIYLEIKFCGGGGNILFHKLINLAIAVNHSWKLLLLLVYLYLQVILPYLGLSKDYQLLSERFHFIVAMNQFFLKKLTKMQLLSWTCAKLVIQALLKVSTSCNHKMLCVDTYICAWDSFAFIIWFDRRQ